MCVYMITVSERFLALSCYAWIFSCVCVCLATCSPSLDRGICVRKPAGNEVALVTFMNAVVSRTGSVHISTCAGGASFFSLIHPYTLRALYNGNLPTLQDIPALITSN